MIIIIVVKYQLNIEWNTSLITEHENVDIKTQKYTEEKKKELEIENDAYLRCEVYDLSEPLIINIKCRAKPNNTSYPTLAYTSTVTKDVNLDDTYVDSKGLYITFYNSASVVVTVMSVVNKNIDYVINIDVIVRIFGFE